MASETKLSPYYNLPLGMQCDVVGLTGAKWSGKTIFSLSIAPGKQPEGHPFAGGDRTLYFDFEKSGGSYEIEGCHRVDVPVELRKKFGLGVYKSIDVFKWFQEQVMAVPAGKYDCIIADPWTDIEDGLMQFVRQNHDLFGFTAAQFAKMEPVAISCAKKYAKQAILDMAARCKVMCFVAHEKGEWKGGRPTGKMVSKGFDTLYEVTSLYLKMEREQPQPGEKPKPPSAVVLKERLSYNKINPKDLSIDWIQVIPGRLPVATPEAIRKYVEHPVGKRKEGMKPEEIYEEKGLSEDEKLLIAAEMEANRATTATMQLTNLERMQAAAKAQASQVASASGINLPQQPPVQEPLTPEQEKEIRVLVGEAFADADEAKAKFPLILKEHSASKIVELTRSSAEIVLCLLRSQKLQIDAAKKLAASGTTSTVSVEQPKPVNAPPVETKLATEPATGFKISAGEVANLKALTSQAFGDDKSGAKVTVGSWLTEFNAKTFAELSPSAGEVIAKRLQVMMQREGTVDKQPEPESQPEVAVVTPESPASSSAATTEQLMTLKGLITGAGWSHEQQKEWLSKRNLAAFRDMSYAAADALINEMRNAALGFQQGIPGNS